MAAENTNRKEMSFLGHLAELRGHIIRSVISIAICGVVVGIFWDYIVEYVIMAPLNSDFLTFRFFNKLGEISHVGVLYPDKFDISKNLTSLEPSAQFTAMISAIVVCGIVISIPYIIWEIWRFVKPGLSEKEKKYAGFSIFSTIFFFLAGVAFSYFMLLPLSTQFLFYYQPFGVKNEWTLSSYISLFVQTILSMGVVFLLPVFVYFLTSVGILTPKFLTTYRKHAFIVVLFIAAIITPNDLLSMAVATLPLWLLYEISILISKSVYKRISASDVKEIVKN